MTNIRLDKDMAVDSIGKVRSKKEISEYAKEDYYIRNKAKYIKIADDRMNGATLESIGRKLNLTRERIRQILQKYFPDLEFPDLRVKYSGRLKGGHMIPCKQCKKKIYVTKRLEEIRKYCSQECFYKYRGFKKLPIPVTRMTKKQFQKYNRERCNMYYHKHKNELWFKQKIKERNRITRLKNLKTNKK